MLLKAARIALPLPLIGSVIMVAPFDLAISTVLSVQLLSMTKT